MWWHIRARKISEQNPYHLQSKAWGILSLTNISTPPMATNSMARPSYVEMAKSVLGDMHGRKIRLSYYWNVWQSQNQLLPFSYSFATDVFWSKGVLNLVTDVSFQASFQQLADKVLKDIIRCNSQTCLGHAGKGCPDIFAYAARADPRDQFAHTRTMYYARKGYHAQSSIILGAGCRVVKGRYTEEYPWSLPSSCYCGEGLT